MANAGESHSKLFFFYSVGRQDYTICYDGYLSFKITRRNLADVS